MTVIGVFTQSSSGKIENTIKKMLLSDGVSDVGLEEKVSEEDIFKLQQSGIDAVIISMNKERVSRVSLDILILEDCDLICYELVGCVTEKTRLIYNADKSTFRFNHQNAISYGMTYTADVTVSSIDDKCDGVSLVFCLQRPVMSMNGNLLYAGEFPVRLGNNGINELLPAITCGMLCDTFAIKKSES